MKPIKIIDLSIGDKFSILSFNNSSKIYKKITSLGIITNSEGIIIKKFSNSIQINIKNIQGNIILGNIFAKDIECVKIED